MIYNEKFEFKKALHLNSPFWLHFGWYIYLSLIYSVRF